MLTIHWSSGKHYGEAVIAMCGERISRLQLPVIAHRLPDCRRCLDVCPPDDKDRANVERNRMKEQ